MICANCRGEVQPGDRFCTHCGTAQASRCVSCGGTVPPGARFCPSCGARQTAAVSRPTPPEPPAAAGPERRYMTVMFCDLAGSTMLASQLDPEDYHQLVNIYYEIVASEVQRFDGFVARHVGDGVLVYFGHPIAHEDDSERAIRAGLAIASRVASLDIGGVSDLNVRIGIATGLVVVDVIGHGSGTERTISGHTPNLAARLQSMARPGAVVVAPSTYGLVSGAFDVIDLGEQHLKGLDPVRVYEIVRPRSRDDRRQAMLARNLPLIGRSEEMGQLLRRWMEALRGEGCSILVSGDPGIGKSRIVQAFADRIAEARPQVLYFHGSPHHENSPLFPVVAALAQAAGLFADDGRDAQLAKAERYFNETDGLEANDRAILAELTSGEIGTAAIDEPMTPRHRMERTLRALIDYVALLTRRQPALIIFEDAHWFDPSSREFIRQLIEAVAALPALMIVTARPTFQPDWLGLAQVSLLHVNRLNRREGADLIRKVSGGEALPDEMIEEMIDRADGVPLFLEELTRTVVDGGQPPNGKGARLTRSQSRPPIPPTLQASLLARLDRLSVARELAQEAASIGREFAFEVIAALSDRAEGELAEALNQLELAGLLLRRGLPPRTSYYFKHALMQDAAYETLTRPKREALHRRIAEIYEERFRDIVETRPEILAHHLEQANLAERAIETWIRAASIAVERGAIAEAVAQLKQGLALIDNLSDEERRRSLELQMQVQLGNALMAARGYTDPETETAFRRARTLCKELGDTRQLMRITWGQFTSAFAGGHLRSALDEAEALLALAKGTNDNAGLQVGHASAGTALLHLGRLAEAEAQLRGALDFDVPDQRAATFLYGQSARVTALAYLGLAVLLRGDAAAAAELSARSISEAQTLGHATTLCFARSVGCRIAFLRMDDALLATLAEQVEREAEDHGLALWRALGVIYRGWSQGRRGQADDAILSIRTGLSAYQAIGAGLSIGLYLATLGTFMVQAGRNRAAIHLFEDAMREAERSGETWVMPEIHRRHAEALAAAEQHAEAQVVFETGLLLAREIGVILWERRFAEMVRAPDK